MTYATISPGEFASFNRGRTRRGSHLRTACAAAAMTAVTLGGTWLLLNRLPVDLDAARGPVTRFVTDELRPLVGRPAGPVAVAARPAPQRLDAAWLDRAPSLGFAPQPFGGVHPLAAGLDPAQPPAAPAEAEPPLPLPAPVVPEVVRSVPLPPAMAPLVVDVPLPTPRPADARTAPRRGPFFRAPNRQGAPDDTAVPTGPADNRTFLQKFFGLGRPTNPALGYAAPEEPGFGGLPALSGPTSSYDRWTAVYEIATHTVYLPDGERLEAHSGLGSLQDDPRHVDARNRGATPPHVYDLTLREALFHGVQALRLNPVGGGSVFGRTGLLAHTYMLGPSGASNGCVSFRDYNAFLQAFRRGEVRRLAVVARLI